MGIGMDSIESRDYNETGAVMVHKGILMHPA